MKLTRIRPAFTLIDIGVVIGIGVVFFAASVPVYENYIINNDLHIAANTIAQSIYRAKTLAQSNAADSAWGVNMPKATLFQGSSYAGRTAAGDQTFNIPATVTTSGLPEVSYTKLDGLVSDTGVVLITARNGARLAVVVDNNGIPVISPVTDDLVAAANSSYDSSVSSVASSVSSTASSVRSSVGSSASNVSSAGSSVSSSSVASSTSSQTPSSTGGGGSSAVSQSSASSQQSSMSSSVIVTSSVGSSVLSSSTSSTPLPVQWGNQNIAVLLLDATGAGAFSITGNGMLNIANANGSVVINSSNSAALKMKANAQATASAFKITGGKSVTGNAKLVGTVTLGVAPTADPLASIAGMSPPSRTFSAVNYSSSTPLTLDPGTYVGGISVSGNANVTLNPGYYYLMGGGLTIAGNATITGRGVVIYNTPLTAAHSIVISGNGKLTLSPVTTGAYTGISIFQARGATNALTVSGNGTLNVNGVTYMPSAALALTGNGAYVNLQCLSGSRFILADLTFSGNGGFNVQ